MKICRRKVCRVKQFSDSFSEYLRTVTPYQVFSYGIDEEAQFMAKNIQESLQGVSFDFVTPFGTYPVKSPYVGKV